VYIILSVLVILVYIILLVLVILVYIILLVLVICMLCLHVAFFCITTISMQTVKLIIMDICIESMFSCLSFRCHWLNFRSCGYKNKLACSHTVICKFCYVCLECCILKINDIHLKSIYQFQFKIAQTFKNS
jgi:hypothetical protein